MKKEDVMPQLLKACPSFEVEWQRLDDEDRSIVYGVMGGFALHLLSMKKADREDVLNAAAQFIERMHAEGDDYVRELATIGILEGIQNIWGNSGENPETFRPYLGKESQRCWDSLNRFWGKKAP